MTAKRRKTYPKDVRADQHCHHTYYGARWSHSEITLQLHAACGVGQDIPFIGPPPRPCSSLRYLRRYSLISRPQRFPRSDQEVHSVLAVVSARSELLLKATPP